MKPLLEAHALTIETVEGRTLVRDLVLQLGRERVAVVGRNGVGKSTLLDVLAGRQAPTGGRVVRRGSHLLVPQQLEDNDQSPGEHRRQRLEQALDDHPDLLMLDEPTTDLDAAGIAWLVQRLSRWRDGLLVVSHDRAVLRAFDRYFVVAETGCRYVEGTFDELRADLAREREASERRYGGAVNALLAEEERNAAVRRRRQRKKNVGRIRELKRCPARIKLNDKRSYKQESQGMRAVLQKVRIAAKRDRVKALRRAVTVALPLELVLPRLDGVGERVAIRGPNGAGKTTLLEQSLGPRAGYIAQNATNWCVEESLVEALACESPELAEQIVRAHRFPRALADRPLATLSPGERLRAALICLTRRQPPPEVLVLDEPTRHLDFEGLAALEAVLAAWPGGLVVVSHDAEFLAAIGIARYLDL